MNAGTSGPTRKWLLISYIAKNTGSQDDAGVWKHRRRTHVIDVEVNWHKWILPAASLPGLANDITEQKQAEVAVREAKSVIASYLRMPTT